MFSTAYVFTGQVHVFEGRVKIVGHSSCSTSAILKSFCPLHITHVLMHAPTHKNTIEGTGFKLGYTAHVDINTLEIVFSLI